jgi:hypothetical protein
MCGSSGADPIYETEADREAIRIAADQYNKSKDLDFLKDFHENSVDEMGLDGQEDYVQGKANIGAQKAYSEAMSGARKNSQASGVDPSSGRSISMETDMHEGMASTGSNAMKNVAFEKDTQHMLGEQNILAVSMGQSGQAQKGLNDIAAMSVDEAINQSFSDFNEHSANTQAVGMAAGMGASAYQNSVSKEP